MIQMLIKILLIALLRFQSESNRKPNPDTSEEDLIELKSHILAFEDGTLPTNEALDAYYE